MGLVIARKWDFSEDSFIIADIIVEDTEEIARTHESPTK
jgi:hypothetical protein